MELTVTNPYDQSIVCSLPYADDSAIETTLEHVQNSQHHWQRLSVAERCERVQVSVYEPSQRCVSAYGLTLYCNYFLLTTNRRIFDDYT